MGAPRVKLPGEGENRPIEIIGFDEDGQPIQGSPIKPNIVVTLPDGSECEGIFKLWEAQLIDVEVDARNGFYDIEMRRWAHVSVRFQRKDGPEVHTYFWSDVTAFWEEDLASQFGRNSPNYRKKNRFVPLPGVTLPPPPAYREHRGDYLTPKQTEMSRQFYKELEAEGVLNPLPKYAKREKERILKMQVEQQQKVRS